MSQSNAATVEEYLASLPGDRRESISRVRKVILDNLPKGYREGMQYGMIGYCVPFSVLPKTYNNQPLGYAALASQKNYMSVYLTNVYSDKETEEWFVARYRATGKKLDMGKSCVRFKKLEDLPVELIGEAIARTPMAEFVTRYKAIRGES